VLLLERQGRDCDIMEDRQQHGPATKLIGEVLREIDSQRLQDEIDGVFRCGASTELIIAQRLQEAGHLTPEEV